MTREGQPAADMFTDPIASTSSGPAARNWTPGGRGRVPGELGVWVLIGGELLIFGLVFIVFGYERAQQIETFRIAQSTMHLTYGAVDTLLLLTSSVFVAWGVIALRDHQPRWSARLFAAAIACGLMFVVSKYAEWSDMLTVGHDPFANSFFMFYFVLTTIHLTHLIAGLAVLIGMCRIARTPNPTARALCHIESGACFWHLVDLIWIILFTLLYLVR
ncbi:cytochrome c oxidase subunit 3 [Pseudonocardia sp. ICBG601]|uniref:cytochrome c oxidase subunit 3 n=1 Tax=Pseudonocardia sp. ICBG601 TaxID=2846759 RepID=UPI001CF61B3F|nr:cytochrome c oxidase subunit 3 [Pseudonocardia sp. ICBG601]